MPSLAHQMLTEELDERGWTRADLIAAMPGDPAVNELAFSFWFDGPLGMDHEMAEMIGAALGTSSVLWERLARCSEVV